MPLTLDPNLPDPDGFYDEFLAIHEPLSDEESADLNMRLVLILANHIGDRGVLSEAFNVAQSSGKPNSGKSD